MATSFRPRAFRRISGSIAIPFVLAGCGRDAGADLGPAVKLVAGPRGAGFVTYDDASRPSRLAADGTVVASLPGGEFRGSHAVFETPADVEDDASGASVLLVSGREASGDAVVRRWRVDGAVEEVARIPLAEGERAEPRCSGVAADGALEGSHLTIVIRDEGGPRRALALDVRTGRAETWPNTLFEPPPELVSVSPTSEYLTVVRRLGQSSELLVASRRAAEAPRVIAGVEPVAPYWLADVAVVLFVRRGGSIAKLMLPNGEPEWLIPGTFSSRLPRADLAVRERSALPGEPSSRVAVEKLGSDGFVQISWVEPFATGSEREKNLTNGSVDHYGAAWSTDRRLLAFRQRERRGERLADEERIVVVDTGDGFAATSLVARTVAAGASDVGPVFGWNAPAIFAIVDGRLRRFELAIETDEP